MGPYTPSGHTVVYGRIPYAFPAGVRVDYSHPLLEPLRQAMIGQRRYDTSDVARALVSLLSMGVKPEAFEKLINDHR